MIVGVTSAALGYATFAFFSDTEVATGNLFTAGDLDLHLNGAEGLTGVLSATNFAPGDVQSATITLTNDGSIFDGDLQGHLVDLDLALSYATTDDAGDPGDADDGGPSTPDLDSFLEVTVLSYDAISLLGGVADANGNGFVDVNDVEASGVFADLADPGAAGKDIVIEISFHTSGGNDLKRDSTEITLTFFLAQAADVDLI